MLKASMSGDLRAATKKLDVRFSLIATVAFPLYHSRNHHLHKAMQQQRVTHRSRLLKS
jgi:fumarate reductase subunit D